MKKEMQLVSVLSSLILIFIALAGCSVVVTPSDNDKPKASSEADAQENLLSKETLELMSATLPEVPEAPQFPPFALLPEDVPTHPAYEIELQPAIDAAFTLTPVEDSEISIDGQNAVGNDDLLLPPPPPIPGAVSGNNPEILNEMYSLLPPIPANPDFTPDSIALINDNIPEESLNVINSLQFNDLPAGPPPVPPLSDIE